MGTHNTSFKAIIPPHTDKRNWVKKHEIKKYHPYTLDLFGTFKPPVISPFSLLFLLFFSDFVINSFANGDIFGTTLADRAHCKVFRLKKNTQTPVRKRFAA